MTNERFLVTGASGFIGSHVVAQLHARGSSVDTVALRDFDPEALRSAVHDLQPTRVIHLGGFTDIGASWTQPTACAAANVGGTLALLDALVGTNCARFVFVSTADVYGAVPTPFREDGPADPASPYAVSKFAAERFALLPVRLGWPPAVVVRPFNVFGPGQPTNRVVPDLILHALDGRDIDMSLGLQRREFNYVDDIAAGIVAAATTSGIEGQTINLGCGTSITIRTLATTILRLMGNPVRANFGALPERPVEVPDVVADVERARELLGWTAERSLEDGLQQTISWYRALRVQGQRS